MRRLLAAAMASVPVPPVAGYLVAVGAVGLALVPKLFLNPVLGRPVPFLLFFAATLLSAWVGGLGPGLAATLLATATAVSFFLPPYDAFELSGHGLIHAALFVAEGTVVTLLTVWAQATLRRAEQRRQAAQALAEVGRLLDESLDPAIVVQRILDSVRNIASAMAVALYRVQPDRRVLVPLGSAGSGRDSLGAGVVLPLEVGIAGLAVREARAVASRDLFADPRLVWTPEVRSRVERSGHRAACAVPLVVKGAVVGVLGVGDRLGRVFGPDDIVLLQAFADQAGLALENARRFEGEQSGRAEAERARARASFLAEAGESLAASLGERRGPGGGEGGLDPPRLSRTPGAVGAAEA